MKRFVPNALTAVRMVCAVALCFFPAFSAPFFGLYLACGLSDMLDGFFARRFHAESRHGAVLDSVADTMFVAAALLVLLPAVGLPLWSVCWIAGIAAVKLFSICAGVVRFHRLAMLHTWANKGTGLLLFFFPVVYVLLGMPWTAVLLCCAASASAAEECVLVLTQKQLDRNVRGLWCTGRRAADRR